MTKLKIEKTLCDDEDSDDEIEYILSIELNQKVYLLQCPDLERKLINWLMI